MVRRPKWKAKLLERVRESDRLVAWDYAASADARQLERRTLFEISGAAAVEDFLADDVVVQLGRELQRIDLLTFVSGVEFDEAYSNRVLVQIGDVATNAKHTEQMAKLIERARSASVLGSIPTSYRIALSWHSQSKGQPRPVTVRRARRCSIWL